MELGDKIQELYDEFKKAVERQDGEIKKYGEPLAETKSYVEKLSKRMDELEVKLQRQSVPTAEAPKETKESKAAFYKWIRGGDKALTPEERKALVEDTTGLYIVEPELEKELVRSLPKITLIRNLATVRTIGSDRLKIRSVSELSVGWGKLETGTEISESTLTPGAATYEYVEDLYGLTKIGEDELQDTDVNLQALLADSFSRAIGEAEDKAFVVGTGHDNNQPEGITVNSTLLTDAKECAASGAIAVEDLMDMVYGCPAQYRKNGCFIMNSTLELAVRKLRYQTGESTYLGGFLWQPSVQEGKPNTLLGYPIYNQDDMKDLTTDGAVIAIFGDIKSGYRILDRQGITLQRLDELYAEAGLVGFRVHKRVGGAVMRASQKPIVLLKEKV